MTREEAIKIISNTSFFAPSMERVDEALDMAIEALLQVTGNLKNPDNSSLTADNKACKEQKSKLDLISRQDAIEAIENIKRTDNWKAAALMVLHDVPSADRQIVDKSYLIKLILESVYDGESCRRLINLVDRPTGECRTCARNADNGGYYEPEHRTRCPIQEHYALLQDGYCHLYEQI